MHAVLGVKGESDPVLVAFDIDVAYDPGFHKLEQLDLNQLKKVSATATCFVRMKYPSASVSDSILKVWATSLPGAPW